MINIRIVETLQHVCRELSQLVHRQVECLHQLIELYLMNILSNYLVVTSVTHYIDATQERDRGKYCMGTIEQGHLTLMVRLLALSDKYMQSCFSAGNSSRKSSILMLSGFSITQRWKISA